MSTPCEERGWKVGDRFEYTHKGSGPFALGSTVELYSDDTSTQPLFRLIDGHCAYANADGQAGAYASLDWVRPMQERGLTDVMPPEAQSYGDFARVAVEQDRSEEEAEADAMIAQYERELHEGVGTQSHYLNCKIQPIDFITENGMDFLEGNVIKYVARYKRKNGLEDLRKAQQYLTWLIEREERKDVEA